MTNREEVVASFNSYADSAESAVADLQTTNAALNALNTEQSSTITTLQSALAAATAAADAAPVAPQKLYPLKGGPAGDIDPTTKTLTLRDSGIVLDGWIIPGFVRNPGNRNKLKNLTVRGPGVKVAKPLALIYTTGLDTECENIKCVPDYVQNGLNGFFGHHFTLRGFEAYHVTDGIDISGDDVLVDDALVHSLALFAPDDMDPARRPVSHNDATQVHDGRNIVISNSRLYGLLSAIYGDALRRKDNPNALKGYNVNWDVPTYALQSNGSLMVNQLGSGEIDVKIENTLLEGGAVHLNVAPNIVKKGQVRTHNVTYGGHPIYPGRFTKDPNNVITSY